MEDNFADFTPENIEEQLEGLPEIDEFNTSVSYEKFIVLAKKDLVNVCRLVEPLIKHAIDEYGKCVYFHSLSDEELEVKYENAPYRIRIKLQNRSGKQVSDFAVSVITLKKLVCQAFASIIIVEQDGQMNIALCESLLFLETRNLSSEQYEFSYKEATNVIDKEKARFVFKRVGSSLSLTERASEKVVVVKDGYVNFNTGVFIAKVNSPFKGSESFVLYKQVADIIATISDIITEDVAYSIFDETLVLTTNSIYIEAQIGGEEKVKEFLSPVAEMSLAFNAEVQIVNDNLLRIITVVKNLDYLSDIVTLKFLTDELILDIANKSQNKNSSYSFKAVSGTFSSTGEMKVVADVLKLFLSIVGGSCEYEFTDVGFGFETEEGKFIIRRT